MTVIILPIQKPIFECTIKEYIWERIMRTTTERSLTNAINVTKRLLGAALWTIIWNRSTKSGDLGEHVHTILSSLCAHFRSWNAQNKSGVLSVAAYKMVDSQVITKRTEEARGRWDFSSELLEGAVSWTGFSPIVAIRDSKSSIWKLYWVQLNISIGAEILQNFSAPKWKLYKTELSTTYR